MKNQKLKGNLLLFLTAFIWGSSFIAQSVGVSPDSENMLSPSTFNGVRSLLGGLVLLPVIYFLDLSKKKKHQPVKKIDKTLIVGGLICGICLCLASTTQTAGMVYTSPGKAGFITALYMVIVPIIGIFLGKKLSPVIVLSVIIAIASLYLLCIDSAFKINKGDIMILICAFIFSGHILAIDYFSPKVDGVKLACMQFFVCGIINVTYALIADSPKIQPLLNSWMPLAYSGFLSCGVAYTLQIVAQKYTDPVSASIIMSLESVFSTLVTVLLVALGWNLTGGALTPRQIAGCAMMFGAIMLIQIPDMVKKKI